jgi:hypothetical protein
MSDKNLTLDSEASERRCCGPHPCGVPQSPSNDTVRWCVGSRCMAWRHVDQIGIDRLGRHVTRDENGGVRWMDRGRCGLVREDRT